jgi:hypothetical protein
LTRSFGHLSGSGKVMFHTELMKDISRSCPVGVAQRKCCVNFTISLF